MSEPVYKCRYCGCTPDEPCRFRGGEECGWATLDADRCNAIECVKKWERECFAANRKRRDEDKAYRNKAKEFKNVVQAARRKKKTNPKRRAA